MVLRRISPCTPLNSGTLCLVLVLRLLRVRWELHSSTLPCGPHRLAAVTLFWLRLEPYFQRLMEWLVLNNLKGGGDMGDWLISFNQMWQSEN